MGMWVFEADFGKTRWLGVKDLVVSWRKPCVWSMYQVEGMVIEAVGLLKNIFLAISFMTS
jgi:hypothetical protein